MSNRRRFVPSILTILAVAGLLSVFGGAIAATAVTLPSGFQEQVVFSGLTRPTNIEFSPDGRIFVAEKRGVIKVYDSLTDPTPDVFADLSVAVHDQWDRGLLGMALAPGFPATPYVYVLYAYDAPIGATAPVWNDACANLISGGCMASGRLSRLRASGNHQSGAEQVLINDWCQQFPSHSIGDLHFGADGALYASAGDGANFSAVDYGQFGNPCGDPPGGAMTAADADGGALRAQDVRSLADPTGVDGAILRLDPNTGAAMPDNPLSATTGDPNARRIVAHGLRNPSRFTIRPGTSEVWAGDVGWNNWEEIDRIATPPAGLTNFGWPCYEGNGRQPGYEGANLNRCTSLYGGGGSAAPYYTYDHAAKVVAGEICPTGGSAITGLAFGPASGGSYPASYRGALFFADYARGCIGAMLPGANKLPDPANIVTFDAGAAAPVDLAIGPGNELYYVDVNGTVRRIRYLTGSPPPVAAVQAAPTSGTAPLAVSFDGTASTVADQSPPTYQWDFTGDGTFDATGATATHTYPAGTYHMTLRVTDVFGSSDTATVDISAGNTTPTGYIDTPVSSDTWAVGDTISFAGHASDPEQGVLPASALSWQLILQHCSSPTSCHAHFLQSFDGVAGGTLQAPDHEYPSYLQLQLTATDADGLRSTRTVSLQPRTVPLTFTSDPVGLRLAVGSSSEVTPFTRTVIVNSTNSVSAPSPQSMTGTTSGFVSWSDGGGQSHVVAGPPTPTTYTATYSGSVTAQSWPVPAAIGGTPRSQVAMASRGNRLDLFTVGNGPAYALTHRVNGGGTWQDWESLGGNVIGNPTAIWSSDSRLDVFVTGRDNGVWHRWWDGSTWHAWESLGGWKTGDIVAVSTASGKIDVFVTGGDTGIWRRSFDGTAWSPWATLGGRTLRHNFAAVADPATGSIHLLVQGLDEGVWYRYLAGTGSQPWTPLGGRVRWDVTAVASAGGAIDLFAPGVDAAVWHRRRVGATWQPWESLGGMLTGAHVEATAWGPGYVDTLIRGGGDGLVWGRRWNGVTWSAWAPLSGSTPAGALPSAVGSSDRIDVCYPDFGANVYHVWSS